jgi:hypothetical protein
VQPNRIEARLRCYTEWQGCRHWRDPKIGRAVCGAPSPFLLAWHCFISPAAARFCTIIPAVRRPLAIFARRCTCQRWRLRRRKSFLRRSRLPGRIGLLSGLRRPIRLLLIALLAHLQLLSHLLPSLLVPALVLPCAVTRVVRTPGEMRLPVFSPRAASLAHSLSAF